MAATRVKQGIDVDQVDALALALPGAVGSPHFQMRSYRVGGRIFATVPPTEDAVHVFLSEEQRALALAVHGPMLSALHWGAKVVGLRVELALATRASVESLLAQSFANKLSRPSRR